MLKTSLSSALCHLAALALLSRLAAASYSSLGRYSRSMSWAPPLYYHRSTRPLYYPEADYYYPQEPYYYPSVYQSIIPGYYVDQQRPYYYGYDEVTDPSEEVQDVLPEDPGSGDYGQETWYQDSNADANARFLQNLILAQIYGKFPEEENNNNDRWVYGETVDSARPKAKNTMAKEDEDVRELKSLVRGPERRDNKLRREKENIFAAQTKPKTNDWNEYRSNNYKRSNNNIELKTKSRKAKQGAESTPAPPQPSQSPPLAPLDPQAPQAFRGQKEVVLPRPSTVRQTRGPREPSVYDTIKRLLHMEDELMEGDSSTSRLQKRSFVPSEESLVAQLGRLKKMA